MVKFCISIRNQSGAGIMSALVGIAISAIVVTVILGMMNLSVNQQKVMSEADTKRVLSSELREVIKAENCGLQLNIEPGDENFSAESKTVIPTGIRSAFLNLTPGGKYDQFVVSEVSIRGYREKTKGTISYPSTGEGFRKASLVISMRNNAGAESVLENPVYIRYDSAQRRIVGCQAEFEVEMMSRLCLSMSGNWDASRNACVLPQPPPVEAKDSAIADIKSCSMTDECGVSDRYIWR